MSLKRIIVIANPRAGKRASGNFDDAHRILSQCVETVCIKTEHPGHARELAAHHGKNSDTIIAVFGGDGTLNEAINGLPPSGILGLLPGGTANVVARELGIPLDLREAAKTLLSGTIHKLDTGRVNDRRYLITAGFGYDAHVAGRVPGFTKKLLGKYAYHLQAILDYPFYTPPRLTVTDDRGQRYTGEFALIANMRRYGGDLFFADSAAFDDGLLDLILFRRFDPGSIIRGIRKAFARQGVPETVADHCRSHSFLLESDRPVPFQIDGETYPPLRTARVTIDPASLRMMAI
ncbi:MAG: diacylglycerol kinase family lipid kinase [Candidatus Riflebacteria bacterium]|nr:diacylglycerol kinase family lipid kinase [Candidatus Riflebacteria bacterium]